MKRFLILLCALAMFSVIPAAGAADDDDVAYVVGGTAVISAQVEADLASLVGSSMRLAGPNRYATAAAVSAEFWVPPQQYVYIATGENFPDALAGGPAAAYDEAPILLVRRDSIPSETVAALQRLDPEVIFVLGGTAVISAAVASQLASYVTDVVVRLAGSNRYETAATISNNTFPGPVEFAYIATGKNFPDALAGGAAAGADEAPLLHVGDTVPASTKAELQRLEPDIIVILGGTAAVSSAVESALGAYGDVVRIAGANRYDTAAALSEWIWEPGFGNTAFLATGANFPDGLTAGPIAGILWDPVLLVKQNSIPPATAAELMRLE